MKYLVVIALCLLANLAWADDKYTDQFDNIDVDEILNSERLLNNYFNCVTTGKKCTPDGQKLREILPEALKTNCEKCNDHQKEISRKIIKFLVDKKPQMFKELEELYDPQHEYRTKHAEELKAEGIVLPD